MEKTMVLWKKLWYYTQNNGTWINEGKNKVDNKKTMKRWFIINRKSYGKIEVFEQIYCFRTLLYYGKNYVSMEKTMVL